MVVASLALLLDQHPGLHLVNSLARLAHLACAGTIVALVLTPVSADHLAHIRETTRPATSGDECHWPLP